MIISCRLELTMTALLEKLVIFLKMCLMMIQKYKQLKKSNKHLQHKMLIFLSTFKQNFYLKFQFKMFLNFYLKKKKN